MATTSRKYGKEEIGQRGDAFFESSVKCLIPPGHDEDFVLIDVVSGMFEFDADPIAAADRLEMRAPDAEIWMRKVGSPYVCHFRGPHRMTLP
ncbi:MAG: hypothetical protein ACKV2Q_01775 [Planctomycetaceae bacterium]